MSRILYILLAFLSLSTQVHALTFVVPDGTTETDFTLPNTTDRLIIEEGGTVQGVLADAVSVIRTSQVVFNKGRVLTTGDGLGGIVVIGNSFNSTITNSGLISTTGDNSIGISLDDGWVVTNSGLISTRGINADGISSLFLLDQILIINSGTIKSTQAFALNLQGTNMTLSLLRGSNLQGPVQVLNDVLFLNVETGLNLALTLATGSTGFGVLDIEAPFALVGNTITVIDPTGFALQADVLADLSDAILDGIYRYRTGFPCQCLPCGCGEVWVQGIGSSRERSWNKKRVGYDNWQGGFLIGCNTSLCGGNAGLFGGVSFGEAEVDQQTQRADTTSYLGGLSYEWIRCKTFLGFALAVGYVDWDNERFVMNNLANEGVEKAKVDTGGGLISSELTAAHRFFLFGGHPTMSFTFRYAGLFLGNYNEKGSLADLSIKNREIDLLTTRFEVALPYTVSEGICCWSIEPYLGVFGRYQVGGNHVEAKLLGQSLCFSSRSPRNLAAFLLGARGIQSYGRFNLFMNLEASFDSCSSSRLLGEGGISFSY